jgi:hypothetical protein
MKATQSPLFAFETLGQPVQSIEPLKSVCILLGTESRVVSLSPRSEVFSESDSQHGILLKWRATPEGFGGGEIMLGLERMFIPYVNPNIATLTVLETLKVYEGLKGLRNGQESLSAFMLMFACIDELAQMIVKSGMDASLLHLVRSNKMALGFMRTQVQLGVYSETSTNQLGIEGSIQERDGFFIAKYPKNLGLDRLVNEEVRSKLQELCCRL